MGKQNQELNNGVDVMNYDEFIKYSLRNYGLCVSGLIIALTLTYFMKLFWVGIVYAFYDISVLAFRTGRLYQMLYLSRKEVAFK